MNNKLENYNYGVDLLKIISMMFIIVLHILSHGGVLNSSMKLPQHTTVWLIEMLCVCGVNCFALTSGFVGYRKQDQKIKFSNLITLWIQVIFYSFGITLFFFIFTEHDIEYSTLIKSILPLTFGSYWYFSAYVGMFMLMPFLNIIVNKMERKDFVKAVICCLLLFSVYGVVVSRYNDPFKINNGYSMVWLSFMYCLGAFIRKYNLSSEISYKKLAVIIIGCYLFMLIWFISIGSFIGHGISNLFISYISPTVVCISIGLLMTFSKLKFNSLVRKSILFFSPAVFGVYLIHDHPIFSEFVIKNQFSFLGTLSVFKIIFILLGIMLIIFIFCIFIDKVRIILFKFLHIKKLAIYLDKTLNHILDKLVDIF